MSMLGEAEGGAVGIHFSWSPQWAVGSDTPRSVEFRADLSAPLQAAARHLRKSAGQLATIEILATVIRLDKAEGKSEKVILYGPVDGSTFRQIEVDMIEEIRPVAVRAYEDKTVVLCAGTLTRRGKRYIMADLTPVRNRRPAPVTGHATPLELDHCAGCRGESLGSREYCEPAIALAGHREQSRRGGRTSPRRISRSAGCRSSQAGAGTQRGGCSGAQAG